MRGAPAVGALAAAALAAAFALNSLLGGDAALTEKKEPVPGARIEILDPAMNALLAPGAAEPAQVADDFVRPNGLCFSPDEKFLYVADSDRSRSHIRRFRVTGPGAPGSKGRRGGRGKGVVVNL